MKVNIMKVNKKSFNVFLPSFLFKKLFVLKVCRGNKNCVVAHQNQLFLLPTQAELKLKKKLCNSGLATVLLT